MIAESTLRELGVGGGFDLRPGIPADENFIFATWLRSYKHSSQFARRVPDRLFYKFHQAAIARILGRGAEVLVCTPPGEPELILGYAVREEGVLHFVYVKKPFRRRGIATALLASQPTLFTHWTNDWDALRERVCLEAQYNPYII